MPIDAKDAKIVLAGGAGLVGQNLIVRLKERGFRKIVCIDKHQANMALLRRLHPGVAAIEADMSVPGDWQNEIAGASIIVQLQAQIGGLYREEFVRNNEASTKNLLAAIKGNGVAYLVHVSSSVVNSRARDFYTETKKAQEALVESSAIKHCVLRPTLMFGWFDRKHLGWLARFMQRAPVFPVPGHGRYIRQPLFVLDFCNVIAACIEKQIQGVYNISGLERVWYIDIIREIRRIVRARAPVVKIPYAAFWLLLKLYALFDKNPPFTTQQLRALAIPEEFEMIDWPGIFGVAPTPWRDALVKTFTQKPYCDVELGF